MKVEVYRTHANSRRHYFVLAGADVSELPLPEPVNTPAWKSLTLDKEKPVLGLSVEQAIQDINEQGFHVSESSIEFGEWKIDESQ
ncbi:MAG: hypothetical protein R3F28_12200 [Candidatus Kapaibacterium sp.]